MFDRREREALRLVHFSELEQASQELLFARIAQRRPRCGSGADQSHQETRARELIERRNRWQERIVLRAAAQLEDPLSQRSTLGKPFGRRPLQIEPCAMA